MAKKLGLVKDIWEASYIPAPSEPIAIATKDAALAKKWDNRGYAGVEEIHKRGILGEGITVGIVCPRVVFSLFYELTFIR